MNSVVPSQMSHGASARLVDESELGLVLITGAAGFLGRNLVKRLLALGCQVRALVHSTPLVLNHANLDIVKADICNRRQVIEACQDVDSVFHTAADICLLGGFAASRAYQDRGHQVNVEGTQNIIDACREKNVTRLIYTSSVDVCFEGKHLPNMNEKLPYATELKSVYAKTKIEAERRVLAVNGDDGLSTCAIRPDGIYGAEPNDMVDRFYEQLMAGKLVARIGAAAVLQDNSHVDNLVHGEILAALHLLEGGVACGQAYFIGDDEPKNSFEFFRPLIEGMGFSFPQREIPAGLLKPLLVVWEALHFYLNLPKPMLSPHELDKVSVTHYASVEKARRELGYEPVISVENAMAQCLEYCLTK